MKILFYDCFAGISGDMNLGALVDLGVDSDYLISELKKLNMDEEFELDIHREQRKGIEGTKVDVVLKNDVHHHNHDNGCEHEHSHEHGHSHDHDYEHGHSHANNEEHGHSHGNDSHVHRGLREIEEILDKSDLTPKVIELSLKMFKRIAIAEAKVHGKELYEVHFHEVGAVDSIVDIVGAAICIDYLNPDRILSSYVEVGSGFANCVHGKIPVPAPATVEILKGIPISFGTVPFEATTPTGAAILAANVEGFTNKMEFVINKTGYGVGTKDGPIPNVLRVYLGTDPNSKKKDEINYIIETNIDDMNPELYTHVEEALLKAGALDVYKTPIIMKKGRPAIKMTILVFEKDFETVESILFEETTSIGYRTYEVGKRALKREFKTVLTELGEVRVKLAYHKGRLVSTKPEYEDCRALAQKHDKSIKDIYRIVEMQIGSEHFEKSDA